MSYIIEFNNGMTETWCTSPSGTPINNTHEKLSRMREDRMVRDVLCLTASGEELTYVNDVFGKSIPNAIYSESVTWYGSIAQTIIANL